MLVDAQGGVKSGTTPLPPLHPYIPTYPPTYAYILDGLMGADLCRSKKTVNNPWGNRGRKKCNACRLRKRAVSHLSVECVCMELTVSVPLIQRVWHVASVLPMASSAEPKYSLRRPDIIVPKRGRRGVTRRE